MTLDNLDIAELFAREADGAEGHRKKALQRGAEAALVWDRQAADLVGDGTPLTELENIGPKLAARIEAWCQHPPADLERPPVRAGFMSYAEARAEVAADESWRDELRGDLQMHTTHSDGKASIAEMAAAGADRGYGYVAITDHSHGLRIVRGMDEARLAEQGRAIDGLNAALGEGPGFRVLRSVEMNLDLEGAGDLEPEALASLDLVLGSFHTGLRLAEDQTERYVRALDNPDVHVLGHPRARRFNRRTGLEADWPRVFDAAARSRRALEIDCHPHRQDLSVELLRKAVEHDVVFTIGTDAHNPSEMRFVEIGLAAARRAGIGRDRILNFREVDAVLEWAGEVAGKT